MIEHLAWFKEAQSPTKIIQNVLGGLKSESAHPSAAQKGEEMAVEVVDGVN